MTEPIAGLILLPLVWASLAFVCGPGRGRWLACAGVSLQLALAARVASEVAAGNEIVHSAGGWAAPLGIILAADGLTVIMLLLAQGVALPLLLYAGAHYQHHPEGSRYFWPLTGYLLAALNALFLSADVFNLYVTLEMLSLAAVGLVATGNTTGSVAAALRYLFVSLLGSGAYLLGVALLYGTYGSLALPLLAREIVAFSPPAATLAVALMLVGLTLKTALFPFHFWLPPAHGGAPAPVSALLSSLVIKGSFYLMVRLWMTLFSPLAPASAAQLLGLLGAIAIVWGSYKALHQARLKMLVAYSTVAQIGYLFLFFPLAASGGPEATHTALGGAVMQAVAHGLAKAAMFGAAGAVILSTGHDDVDLLGGISSHLPLTLFTFALAGVTLMGLPPSAGFLAKWLLIDSAISTGQWWWVVVMIAGGLLTAAYVFKVLRHAFLRTEQSAVFRPLPRLLEWPAFLLALASVALGLQAAGMLALLEAA